MLKSVIVGEHWDFLVPMDTTSLVSVLDKEIILARAAAYISGKRCCPMQKD